MFIAKYKNGKIVTEKDTTWDKIEDGMVSLELTIPITLFYTDPETNEQKRAPSRTISLLGQDKYFFNNEAVAHLDVNHKDKENDGQGKLVAQQIGGIRNGIVTLIRIDKKGFCKVFTFDEKDLHQTDIKIAG